MKSKIINGEEYRLVTVRGRSKWISKHGDAYNPIRYNQKATIHINSDGYPCFGGGVPVHLYVANGWVDGKFEGTEVDHIDCDRMNYDSDNLRWVTHEENVQHSVDMGHYDQGQARGENNPRAVFTQNDVDVIRKFYAIGYTTMEIIKMFYPNFSYDERRKVWSRFNRIKTNETWN